MKKLILFIICLLILALPTSILAGSEFTILHKYEKDLAPKLPDQAFMMPDKVVYWNVQSGIGVTESYQVLKIFAVMEIEKSKRLVIILNSPGGNPYDGLNIGALIQEKVKSGVEVEIRGYGIIASAATLVFMSGTKGKRLIDPYAVFMTHSVLSYKYFEVSDLAKDEKEYAKKKLIQGQINAFVSEMTGISEETLWKLIKEETWFTAAGAVKNKFADGMIENGKKK